MKMMLALALAGLLAPLLTGCATSRLEHRKQERYDAYTALPAPQRAAVDAGRIAMGMPMDAVYIAWGKPSRVVESESAAGKFTVWLYHDTYLQSVSYWGYRWYPGSHHYPYYSPSLMLDYVPVGYVRAEVIFEKGAVKEWRTLPPPAG
ncbi:MAG: hypothetical protein RJA22_638 [Verrucomicrobiota bacterium]|jgi:hypothetical protein